MRPITRRSSEESGRADLLREREWPSVGTKSADTVNAGERQQRARPALLPGFEAWPNPEASSLDAMYAILDDKDQPYYEHKLGRSARTAPHERCNNLPDYS
jgi:hypothetical protein